MSNQEEIVKSKIVVFSLGNAKMRTNMRAYAIVKHFPVLSEHKLQKHFRYEIAVKSFLEKLLVEYSLLKM